jgi:hypothetical protein
VLTDPRGMIYINFVEVNRAMLHDKYLDSRHVFSGSKTENMFSLTKLYQLSHPRDGVNPRGMIKILVFCRSLTVKLQQFVRIFCNLLLFILCEITTWKSPYTCIYLSHIKTRTSISENGIIDRSVYKHCHQYILLVRNNSYKTETP